MTVVIVKSVLGLSISGNGGQKHIGKET